MGKSPLPLFAKEGISSLWKREERRDFVVVLFVIPAKAGIQSFLTDRKDWIPAFAGMTFV